MSGLFFEYYRQISGVDITPRFILLFVAQRRNHEILPAFYFDMFRVILLWGESRGG